MTNPDPPESAAATALQALIEHHYPGLLADLQESGHHLKWLEIDDDWPALWVDGGTAMFAKRGDDLHVTGPLAGKVPCIVIKPDGSWRMAAITDDPLAAQAEKADQN